MQILYEEKIMQERELDDSRRGLIGGAGREMVGCNAIGSANITRLKGEQRRSAVRTQSCNPRPNVTMM